MDTKFMKAALKQAQIGLLQGEVPVGCVIVKDGKIIARAHNTKESKKAALNHAEINAIVKASKKFKDWRLNDCEMYVTLEPCLMCVGAIINYRVGTIYYGAKDPKGGAVVSNLDITTVKNLNHHPIFQGGIMEQECGEILTKFFQDKRKR
ncbi:MAG: nucleoside deaminase [Bacilli bacterium]|nr:nucleoside deaminase [Bacilli bacterium]MDD3421928.1 nucleoside deaminase [Bacilli bacterium]MDD4066280.1 nucleoside deaminase [Bacilli bacterium]